MRELPRKTDPHVDLPHLLAQAQQQQHQHTRSGDSSREMRAVGGAAVTNPSRVVAMAVTDPHIQHAIRAVTADAAFAIAGPEAVSFADVVLIDDFGKEEVGQTIARLRANARTDAAIVYIFSGSRSESVSAAHAAGAFACMRFPFVGNELVGLMRSAVDATTAKVRVADLAKQLDVHTHLASIGRMSAGLSHEIANPLSVAMGTLHFIRQEMSRLMESERLLRCLSAAPQGEIEHSIHAARAHLASSADPNELYSAMDDTAASYQRIEALLTNLRVLIGQGVVKQQRVDLLALVRDVRRWAAEPLHGVNVEEEGGSLWVRTDANLLGQIVLNLATNAALAAKSLSAPRVRFHVYASGAQPNGGGGVVISIRDNGPGIPEDMQDKIFEPFFTTRRGRGGTGLGLSLCRELSRQIGAEISFWSVLGRGTCFRVCLPSADSAGAGPPRPGQPPPLPMKKPGVRT